MYMSVDPAEKSKEGRVARHLRTAAEIRREPRTLLSLSRSWLARLWQAKGGGFYGLGYVVTFVWLEFRSLTGEIAQSTDVGSFLAGQVFGYLIRFSLESFLNVAVALVWPVLLLQSLGVWAIPLLAAGFVGFERAARPHAEAWFPELRAARLDNAAKQRDAGGT
ncbi:MAG TPA: hypothetical protein VKQ06_09985 [Gammaproteobacteria bacterium]|nr:hypothetical protein [Gammaproteobacteria bacterium]